MLNCACSSFDAQSFLEPNPYCVAFLFMVTFSSAVFAYRHCVTVSIIIPTNKSYKLFRLIYSRLPCTCTVHAMPAFPGVDACVVNSQYLRDRSERNLRILGRLQTPATQDVDACLANSQYLRCPPFQAWMPALSIHGACDARPTKRGCLRCDFTVLAMPERAYLARFVFI